MYELTQIRAVASDDRTHEHIELAGYDSPHMPGEPIMVSPQRIAQHLALGEKFWVVVDGEKVDVQPGPCPVCGVEPQLVAAGDTASDRKLLRLKRI